MSIILDSPVIRCGKPTRRGQCQVRLRGAKCFVHDGVDLAKRNARVAQAFREKDPEGFTAQRRAAGHAGYVATGERKGWQRANQYAIRWRIAHRSEPERWCERVLTEAGYTAFEREYQIDADPRTLDLAFVGDKVCIEVNGHQDKCAFGERESRAAKHAAKVAWLAALGWRVLVVQPNGDRTAKGEKILAWLSQFPLRATDEGWDELPF